MLACSKSGYSTNRKISLKRMAKINNRLDILWLIVHIKVTWLLLLLIMRCQWHYIVCGCVYGQASCFENEKPPTRKHLRILQRRTWQAHQLSYRWEKAKCSLGLLGLPQVISLINIHSSREWELISGITFHDWRIHLSKIAVRCSKCSVLCAETWVCSSSRLATLLWDNNSEALPMKEIRFWFICILLAANHHDFCIASQLL